MCASPLNGNVRRILDASGAPDSEWMKEWTVDFDGRGNLVEPLANFPDLGEVRNRLYYPLNLAFSSSFEDFAQSLIISDASDED